jgi:ATP-dependent helicase HepA
MTNTGNPHESLTTHNVGKFVNTPDKFWIGRLTEIVDGNIAKVRFTSSPGKFFERRYPLRELKSAILDPQSRVTVWNDEVGGWSYGRVLGHAINPDDGSIEYDIQFPNNRYQLINEKDLEIRCFSADLDPADFFANRSLETQYFHDHRFHVMDALVDFRSAGFSFSGALSSSVVLLEHQISAVKRVLRDPVQRYLLADEVGLGKTIETGCILRQWIAEDREASVLVVVPAGLVQQWRNELSSKFGLTDDLVEVIELQQLSEIDTAGYSHLVVDEAHGVVSDFVNQSHVGVALHHLAERVPKLLLLSATPVLGDPQIQLAMLSLLDPQTFDLSQIDRFRSIVSRRQEIGRILLGLDPDAPGFLITPVLDELDTVFSDQNDETLSELRSALEEAIDDDSRAIHVDSLRRYIADSYRLHHRVVRNRRQDNASHFKPREGAVQIEHDEDDRYPYLFGWLEDFRIQSQEGVHVNKTSEDTSLAISALYIRFIDALAAGVDCFEREVKNQLDELENGQLTTFPSEKSMLQEAMRLTQLNEGFPRDDVVSTALADILLPNLQSGVYGERKLAPRIIVFGSTEEAVEAAFTHLRSYVLPHRHIGLFLITDRNDAERADSILKEFRSFDGPAFLFTDRTGEEGINVQYANAIAHLDLPFAVDRIEQRIGRLDRLGRADNGIVNLLITPMPTEDTAPYENWIRALTDGFEVFKRSISDVQFIIQTLKEEMANDIYSNGPTVLSNWSKLVKHRVEDERERLNEQYSFDKLASLAVDGPGFKEVIDHADSPFNAVAIDRWLTSALGFTRVEKKKDIFEYEWRPGKPLVTRRPWFDRLSPGLNQPLTIHRKVALLSKGVQILRPGHPLVDELVNYLAVDDRGVSFATARYRPNLEVDEMNIIKVTFVIEAKLDENVDLMNSGESDWMNIVRRRADEILNPRLEVLWMDEDLQRISNEQVLAVAKEPYSSNSNTHQDRRRDFNLGSREGLREFLIERSDFTRVAESVSELGFFGLARDHQKAQLNNRISVACRGLDVDIQSLERRHAVSMDERDAADAGVQTEIRLLEAVRSAIEQTSPRLDSIGVISLFSNLPAGFTTDDGDE